MSRNYSPNHPAVRSSLNGTPRQLSVRERRAAVNTRRGRTNALPRSRAIVGGVSVVAVIPAMAWGDSNGAVWLPFAVLAFAAYCLAPWIRKDVEEVRQWR